MRILFHSDAYASQMRYGLGRYARELWAALKQGKPELELIPFALRHKASKGMRDQDSASIKRPSVDGRLVIGLWSTLGVPPIESWTSKIDVVHSVELDYAVAVSSSPWVTTVHDLGPLTHPEYFSKSRPWMRKISIQQAIKKAAVIVAVSNTTAEAIEHIAKRPLSDRLQVVPEGVSKEFFIPQDGRCLSSLKDIPPEGTPYFLWTGSFNPRKNLKNVVDAFQQVADHIPQHLILAGGLGWDHGSLLVEIDNSPFKNRIHRPGYVSDEQLRALYQGADGFIYVSLMEGFGLPILEAMAGGCPVVTSNISSMPEVAGDAALLVDPKRPSEIANALQRLSTDRQLRQELAARGLRRANSFTWEKSADAMLKIYENAC
jgi:glycosyltransferase involved in cell wall biosynthesis